MPKSKRWFIVSGICLILAGVWQVWEGWLGLRAAIPLDEWVLAAGAGAFLVFLGLCFFGVALGLVKLKGGRQ